MDNHAKYPFDMMTSVLELFQTLSLLTAKHSSKNAAAIYC